MTNRSRAEGGGQVWQTVVPAHPHARRVRCPSLLQLCEQDTVAPPAAAEKAARRMPHAEVVHYPLGHFDVYFDAAFERSVADQEDFLRRQLL